MILGRILLGCGLLILGSSCQTKSMPEHANLMPVSSTIAVDGDDTKDSIVIKAAHVVPKPIQLEALKDEFIAFIHFGPNTFTRMEWGNGMEDPKIFDLKTLDTDQWCEAMKAAGMTKVILTVKHHDGFCLWQTRYTKHGIMSTDFEDGKGDILKDLSASCEKYGLKLGVYLSPADLYQIENPEGLYGNLSEVTERVIPRPVEGRPFENKKTFKFEVDDYNEYFLNQLFELLTEYGPIYEVWFDGAHPKRKGNQQYNYMAWKEVIRTLAPEAVIFGKEDIRWCGNEAGGTRTTEFNIISYEDDPNQMSRFKDLMSDSLGMRHKLYNAKYLHYQQAETNTSIREGWFYRDDVYQKVRSADDVFDIYERSVGGNSTFLLNIPPNREGKFSPEDISVLEEVGKRIEETYSVNLLANAKGYAEVLDTDASTYVMLDSEHNSIEFTTPTPVTINRFMIQEEIAGHGERVEAHELQAWIDNDWKTIAKGTNIGYKRILRFPDVTSDKFRLVVSEYRYYPAISSVSAFYYKMRPPQLDIIRNADGEVSIEPHHHDFGWKPHGEDVLKNSLDNFNVHYTVDGSEPTAESPLYEGPVSLNSGDVKAIAIGKDGEKGSVASRTFGTPKSQWKLAGFDSEDEKRKAVAAFDADPGSYWQSKEGNKHFIAVDLGSDVELRGFSYTPQTKNSNGMMASGTVWGSMDGKKWEALTSFEFGNLINDPSRREHYFENSSKVRFVKVEATKIAGGDKTVAIAELDFFVK